MFMNLILFITKSNLKKFNLKLSAEFQQENNHHSALKCNVESKIIPVNVFEICEKTKDFLYN